MRIGRANRPALPAWATLITLIFEHMNIAVINELFRNRLCHIGREEDAANCAELRHMSEIRA